MKSIQILFAAFLCLALSAHRVAADVPNPGFNSLFIGHSFFKPFAVGMPDYVAAAGIAGHSQSVVFAGGANGAPQALWEDASKRASIQAVLNTGNVELFGMTYEPTYSTTEGYENWIDYALAQNPNTHFFVALPWLDRPGNYDAATYASTWLTAHATTWHDFIDSLRALYPGVDIFAIPYGQSAVELRNLLAADNLPGVPNLIGDAGDSIYVDAKGHPGDILRDVGRLVWLNAIYDVDLSTYTYGPSYGTTDLKAIAKSIMDGHDPDYDAAYLTDSDEDGVADFVVSLEEPISGEVHGGIGNLRGWVISNDGIDRVEMWLNGSFLFEVPYGGDRPDVAAAYPNTSNSQQSGYSMAFGYSNLGAGTHTITTRAYTTMGEVKESSATFTVVTLHKDFIPKTAEIDTGNASADFSSDEILLNNVTIDGRDYDLKLKWRTAEQGFEIIEAR